MIYIDGRTNSFNYTEDTVHEKRNMSISNKILKC